MWSEKGMEKEVWVRADVGEWEEKKLRTTTALESGADFVLVDSEDVPKVRELGMIKTAAFVLGDEIDREKLEGVGAEVLVFGKGCEGDGTTPLLFDYSQSKLFKTLESAKDVVGKERLGAYIEIRGKEYERLAVALASFCRYLIVIGKDWKVIPLENLIAELQKYDVRIIAGVKDVAEARTAFETLEHGADGVLIDTDDPNEIKKTLELRERLRQERLPLTVAKVTKVEPLGMGDRACVDTCSLMRRGEGMLVGSFSGAFFLVHSETEESPYVEARPFRVNAGAVHSYILVGDRTKYLAELSAGDEVLIVNSEGVTRKATVGRVKIERRPLILVEAEAEGRRFSVILQNAETIKLMGKERPISVAELKEGDEVLVHLSSEARHFGISIDETIIEK